MAGCVFSIVVAPITFPLLMVAALLAWQQIPPRDTPPASMTSGSVRGRVVDKETGQPIHRATVQLSLPASGSRHVFETSTDTDGRYEFPSVPAGDYYASATQGEYRSGHQAQGLGGPPPLDRPPLAVKSGETRIVDFALPRTYAIEGRVLNEYGDALADILVSAERIDRAGVGRTLRSDDRGNFRLFGLPPGTYRVCGDGDGPTANVTGGDVVLTRYVRTCIPAGDSGADAVSLKSADVAGVMIQMHRGGAFTVSGRVVDEAGAPVENGSVQIYSAGPGVTLRSGSAEFRRGAFVAKGLTPGDYAIRAMVYEPDPYAGASGPRDVGYLPVRVDGDISGLVVVARRGVDVVGHVVFEGGRPPAASTVRAYLRLDLEAQPIYRMEGVPPAALKADHTFELKRIRGPRLVTLTGLPQGWLVKSVRYRGTDITDVSTEFTPGTDPRELEVVATNRTARVVARVVDENGQRVEGAVAFLIPTAPERWKAGPIPLPSQRPQDGTVRPRAILPGDYFLTAVPSADYTRLTRSLEIIKAVAATAPRVRIGEDDVRTVDVPLGRMPGR